MIAKSISLAVYVRHVVLESLRLLSEYNNLENMLSTDFWVPLPRFEIRSFGLERWTCSSLMRFSSVEDEAWDTPGELALPEASVPHQAI